MADLGEPATPPKPTEIQDEGTPLKPRRTRAPMSEEKRQAAADNMRKINQNRIDKARAARSSSIDERLEDVEKKAAAKIAKLHLEKSEIGVYNTKTKRPPQGPHSSSGSCVGQPSTNTGSRTQEAEEAHGNSGGVGQRGLPGQWR